MIDSLLGKFLILSFHYFLKQNILVNNMLDSLFLKSPLWNLSGALHSAISHMISKVRSPLPVCIITCKRYVRNSVQPLFFLPCHPHVFHPFSRSLVILLIILVGTRNFTRLWYQFRSYTRHFFFFVKKRHTNYLFKVQSYHIHGQKKGLTKPHQQIKAYLKINAQ